MKQNILSQEKTRYSFSVEGGFSFQGQKLYDYKVNYDKILDQSFRLYVCVSDLCQGHSATRHTTRYAKYGSNLNSLVNLFTDADIKILIINHFGAFGRVQFKKCNGLVSKSLPSYL